jgi:hypothetical protein
LNWNYAWSPAWFPSAALSKMCNPKLSTLDDATRSDCLQVFRTLADSRASAGWRYMGLAGIARIQKDAASASRRTELWRQAQWIREQDVWARERLPLSRAKEYMQDMAQYGAWEADLRQADHVGVSRMPPASWEARVAIPEARD